MAQAIAYIYISVLTLGVGVFFWNEWKIWRRRKQAKAVGEVIKPISKKGRIELIAVGCLCIVVAISMLIDLL